MAKITKLLAIIFGFGLIFSNTNNRVIKQASAEATTTVNGNLYGAGEYYLFNSDFSLSLNKKSDSVGIEPVGFAQAESINFVDTEGGYYITKTIGGTDYYLSCSDSNTSLDYRTYPTTGSTTYYRVWSYDNVKQDLTLLTNKTTRYLGTYTNNGNVDWKLNYNKTATGYNYKINLIQSSIYEGFVGNETKASLKLSYTEENETYNVSNIGLRFGGAISKDLKDRFDTSGKTVTYGVKYSYTPVGGNLVEGKTTLAKYVKSFGDYTECSKEEANYYQFFLSINKFPMDQLNTVITAQSYILVNDDGGANTEYLMRPKSYSVKQMCETYLGSSSILTNDEKSQYSGVLNYIISEANK